MPSWPLESWLAIGAIIAGSLLAILHLLSHLIREDERIYAHTEAVRTLRETYAKRLREMEASTTIDISDPGPPGDFDIVDASEVRPAA